MHKFLSLLHAQCQSMIVNDETDSSEKNGDTLILVSHSGKQYVHRMVQGLLFNKFYVCFCAPIWFQKLPVQLRFLPASLRKKISNELKKRQFTFEGNIKLVTAPFIALRKEFEERIFKDGIEN